MAEFYDPRDLFADSHDYIMVDEKRVCIRKPEHYGTMPSLRLPAYLEFCSHEYVKSYWHDIHDDKTRITSLNGLRLEDDGFGVDCIRCDYCLAGVKESVAAPSSIYYMCTKCHTDMCGMCRDEVDEATAIKNGARNWHQRRDQLEACRKHGLMAVTRLGSYCCDICGEDILESSWRQSPGKDGNTIDICSNCEPDESMAGLSFTTFIDKGVSRYDASGYGSLLDWIPIAHDRDDYYGEGIVFICMNRDSSNYNHVAVGHGDDHGRGGVFDLAITWDEFTKQSDEIITRGHPVMKSGYTCDVCRTEITADFWQQADNRGNTVDVCPGCTDTEKMEKLSAEYKFYRFPPGDPVNNARHIVRLWMKIRGDNCYYG